MIRREFQLAGQPSQWLLVSQVEHARISGLFAKQSLPHREEAFRGELLQAVIHHDDGWAAWEANPQLDMEHRRPLSFRELPLEVSLPIWTVSIEAAADVGPLAAWVVAGHFLALLFANDRQPASLAADWQQKMTAQRTKWLADWQAIQPTTNTRALADEALHWLQWFDVLSLWLCSACPGRGEQIRQTPESYHVATGKPLETEFSYDQGRVRIEPWRFDASELQIEAAGCLVPVQVYDSVDELLAARVAHTVHWRLAAE